MSPRPEVPRPRLRVAVLGGTVPLVRHAHALGVDVVLLQRPDDIDASLRPLVETIVPADYGDTDTAVRVLGPLHRARPFRLVLSLTEDGLVSSAEAAQRFGLSLNPPKVARLLRDKAAMRARLNDAGLGPVRARTVRSASALAAFAAEVGGPVILKPVRGTGSAHVRRLDSPADAARTWAGLPERETGELLAEEYLEGPEVSVEAFSHQGRHTVVACTDKLVLDNFVEIGHTVPSRMAAADHAAVAELVTGFLDLTGLREGPSHTEVKLTPAGPRIIESHNRVGGDKIRVLVAHATGLDLSRLALSVPLGLEPAPGALPQPRAGASIRFLTPPPGVVRSVEVPPLTDPHAEVEVTVAAGDTVSRPDSSDARIGHVLAVGADAADAERACLELARRVRVVTGPEKTALLPEATR
ncbi:ATP-grasp domain-containing protein [Streptomyces malaysiensis]|uniref:ATP-grasp domain-containing protein n=1 Tax=Streptomyces malaysiensis TaxID=92644 RepID=UPI0033E26D79